MAKRDKSEAECMEVEISPVSVQNRQANSGGRYDQLEDEYLLGPKLLGNEHEICISKSCLAHMH